MNADDAKQLRAIESALSTLVTPGDRRRVLHLIDWCRQRAKELEHERRRLLTWPDPGEVSNG